MTETPKRIMDINGDSITLPEEYSTALNAINALFDKLEQDNIDRSDMAAVLLDLVGEAQFHLRFLEDRD